MRRNKRVLGTLFISVMCILVCLSLGMVASVSYPKALVMASKNSSIKIDYFLTKQLLWSFIGIIIFFVTSMIDYKRYKKWRKIFYIVGLVLLISVLVIGKDANGAKRWLDFKFFSFQPSEFVKLILILILSSIIEYYKKRKFSKENEKGLFLSVAIFTMPYIVLVILEKSFTSTLQIFLIAYLMLFFAGISLSILISLGVVSSFLGMLYIFIHGYSSLRIDKFLGKTQDEQTINSLIAIRRGKFFGQGYGNGLQKYFKLPEIHTDYIFAGFAEEMGFVGSVALILLYIMLLSVIVITALKIKDLYGRYILLGIFVMLAVQIIGNIMVVTGLFPSTGIPLPLMSYGGSTIIVVMISLGIVYNIIKSVYIQETE